MKHSAVLIKVNHKNEATNLCLPLTLNIHNIAGEHRTKPAPGSVSLLYCCWGHGQVRTPQLCDHHHTTTHLAVQCNRTRTLGR